MREFELGWATRHERTTITELLRQQGRQTMNIRLMPSARFARVLCRGQIVACGGLDAEFDPEHPELFSLYVTPAFRLHRLGRVVELARALYLKERGISTAYVRMEGRNGALVQHRLSMGSFQQSQPAELPQTFLALCRKCELYGTDCTTQLYFKLDLVRFVEEGVRELGTIDLERLPATFSIPMFGDVPAEERPALIWR